MFSVQQFKTSSKSLHIDIFNERVLDIDEKLLKIVGDFQNVILITKQFYCYFKFNMRFKCIFTLTVTLVLHFQVFI